MNKKMTLAQKLITENKRTKDTFLDLGDCGLTELPKELFECIWLKYLILSSDYFDYDDVSPSVSSNYLHKEEFDLEKNQIPNLTGIEKLHNLEELILNDIEIKKAESISNLHKLKKLVISNNKLQTLSFIRGLKKLELIDFSSNQITKFPYFLKDFPLLQDIYYHNNPYEFNNEEYVLHIFFTITRIGIYQVFENITEYQNFFFKVASTIEKQIKEQENYINLKIPKDFKRIFSRYILLFSEYVSIAKGKVIEFHVRSQDDALVLVTNGKTNISREKVLEYLEEYVMLLAQDLENQRLVLNIENQEITNNPKLEVKIDTFTLRYQIEKGALKSEMRILELENKHLQQELSIYRLQSERDNQRIIFLQDMFQHGIRKTI